MLHPRKIRASAGTFSRCGRGKPSSLTPAVIGIGLLALAGCMGVGPNIPTAIAGSPDQKLLATGWTTHHSGFYGVPLVAGVVTRGSAITVRILDAESGQDVRTLYGHPDGKLLSLAFTQDSRRLVSVSHEAYPSSKDVEVSLLVWECSAEDCLRRFTESTRSVSGYVPAAVSSDGKRLLLLSADGMIKCWDTETRKELLRFVGHDPEVLVLSLSPDGKLLAAGYKDFSVELWDFESGKQLRTVFGNLSPVHAMAFSPDGRHLAMSLWDETVNLLDLESWKIRLALVAHCRMNRVVFSPDGRKLLTYASDLGIRVDPDTHRSVVVQNPRNVALWDMETGAELWSRNREASHSASFAFSPDGLHVTSVGGTTSTAIALWKSATGADERILTIK